jgi:hypothetical protein
MENVLINKLELASELANKQLINDYTNTFQLIDEDTTNGIKYTEEAQDIFNELYDEYLQLIDSLTIKQ